MGDLHGADHFFLDVCVDNTNILPKMRLARLLCKKGCNFVIQFINLPIIVIMQILTQYCLIDSTAFGNRMLAGFINQSLKLLFVDVHNASSLLEFFTAMNTIASAEVIRMAGKRLAIDAEQMLQHVTEAIINVRLILVRIGVARDPRLFTILPETPRPFFVDHWVPPRTESSCFQAFLLELFSTTGITISSSVKRSFLFCCLRRLISSNESGISSWSLTSSTFSRISPVFGSTAGSGSGLRSWRCRSVSIVLFTPCFCGSSAFILIISFSRLLRVASYSPTIFPAPRTATPEKGCNGTSHNGVPSFA